MIKHQRIKIVVSVALLSLIPAPVFAIDNDGQKSFRERGPNEEGVLHQGLQNSHGGSDVSFSVADSGQSACYDTEIAIDCPTEGTAFFGN